MQYSLVEQWEAGLVHGREWYGQWEECSLGQWYHGWGKERCLGGCEEYGLGYHGCWWEEGCGVCSSLGWWYHGWRKRCQSFCLVRGVHEGEGQWYQELGVSLYGQGEYCHGWEQEEYGGLWYQEPVSQCSEGGLSVLWYGRMMFYGRRYRVWGAC